MSSCCRAADTWVSADDLQLVTINVHRKKVCVTILAKNFQMPKYVLVIGTLNSTFFLYSSLRLDLGPCPLKHSLVIATCNDESS